MEETALTQEAIDTGIASANGEKVGLLAKAASHPVLAGSALLVGAGLAYAAAKAIKVAAEDSAVARRSSSPSSSRIDSA